jgi:phage baseplate assembly protein V
MKINQLLNVMRLQAETVSGNVSHTRIGTISSYDPNNYAVKVLFQPDGTQSGWLPLGSAWVGNGWGMFAPPSPGTMVKVHFQEGNPEAGIVDVSFYNDNARPESNTFPSVPAGMFQLVHKTGSAIQLNNDGSVNIISNGDLNITTGGATTVNVTGQVNLTATGKVVSSASEFDLTGNVVVTGSISATGDVSDSTGAMSKMRTQYNPHTHGATPPPSPIMN